MTSSSWFWPTVYNTDYHELQDESELSPQLEHEDNIDDLVADPSKFFLIRQVKSNPEVKDCRQLTDWMKLDWNDPDDIEHPKKQIRNRTSDSIALHRPAWRERDLGEACGEVAQRMLALGGGYCD